MASRSRSAPLITTLSNVKAAPKWSLCGRFHAKTNTHQAPGPGAYPTTAPDKSKYPQAPKYAFGSSSRDGLHGLGSPGPGQYTPFDPNFNTPKYGFGTSTRGAMVGRRSASPGPGTYEYTTSLSQGPKYTAAGRRAHASKALGTPGPGAYKPVDSAAAEAAPKWGFGTSSRGGFSTLSGTPGPGTYNQETTMCGSANLPSAPKYSMKPRREQSSGGMNTPGPGAHGGAFTQFG